MSWGSVICKIYQLMKYDINLVRVAFVIRTEMEGEIHRWQHSELRHYFLFFII
jgi:hypothetical protein